MIKVTVKEAEQNDKGYRTKLVVKEHKDGEKANVYNGVLSIFPKEATNADFGNSIAGYEPSVWVSWEKVS